MTLDKFQGMITKELKPIELKDIQEIEKKYNFVFPEMIRQFYLKYNGGHIDKNQIFVENREYDFHIFYPIKYGKCTFEKSLYLVDFATEQYIYPKFLVPFACDRGGNDYLFSLKREEEGAIYFIDHESYEGEEDIQYICENIEDFLNMLF